jgi:hypothetical protein
MDEHTRINRHHTRTSLLLFYLVPSAAHLLFGFTFAVLAPVLIVDFTCAYFGFLGNRFAVSSGEEKTSRDEELRPRLRGEEEDENESGGDNRTSSARGIGICMRRGVSTCARVTKHAAQQRALKWYTLVYSPRRCLVRRDVERHRSCSGLNECAYASV